MDGCFGLSPNHHILSKEIFCCSGKRKATEPSLGLPQPFFRNKKSQDPYVQTLVFPTFKQFS